MEIVYHMKHVSIFFISNKIYKLISCTTVSYEVLKYLISEKSEVDDVVMFIDSGITVVFLIFIIIVSCKTDSPLNTLSRLSNR